MAAAPFRVRPSVFIRDVLFYLLAASAALYFCYTGEVMLWQALFFPVLYCGFVFVVVSTDRAERQQAAKLGGAAGAGPLGGAGVGGGAGAGAAPGGVVGGVGGRTPPQSPENPAYRPLFRSASSEKHLGFSDPLAGVRGGRAGGPHGDAHGPRQTAGGRLAAGGGEALRAGVALAPAGAAGLGKRGAAAHRGGGGGAGDGGGEKVMLYGEPHSPVPAGREAAGAPSTSGTPLRGLPEDEDVSLARLVRLRTSSPQRRTTPSLLCERTIPTIKAAATTHINSPLRPPPRAQAHAYFLQWLHERRAEGPLERLWAVGRLPFDLARRCTVPSVEDQQWNLLYAVVVPVLSPLFLLFSVRDVLAVDHTVFSIGPLAVPLWTFMLVPGAWMAHTLRQSASHHTPPAFWCGARSEWGPLSECSPPLRGR